MSSLDDNFFGPLCIPIDHCYDQILIGVTKCGGHCTYLEGKLFPTQQWWTQPAITFIQHFNKKNNKQDSDSQSTQLLN